MKTLTAILLTVLLSVSTFAQRLPRPIIQRAPLAVGGSLVVDGNSLPYLYTENGQEWCNMANVLGRRLDAGYGQGRVTPYLAALPGLTIEEMIQRAPQYVDSHYLDTAHNVLVSWEGVNSVVLRGDTVETAFNAYLDYGYQRQSLGWHHIAVTMSATPWVDSSPPLFLGDWENVKRYQFDDLIRISRQGWNQVADLADDPTIAENIQSHGAGDRHPENYLGAGDVHFSRKGITFACDAVFPKLPEAFGFDAPNSLVAKLQSVFPLWAPQLSVQTTSIPDYWGTDHADTSANTVQSGDHVILNGFGDVHTNGSYIPHTLHARQDGFAISIWFRPTATPRANDQRIYGVWGGEGQREYLAYIPANDNRVTFSVIDGSGIAHSVVSAITLTSDWQLLEAGYDGTNTYVTVNNETPVSTDVASLKADSNALWILGSGNPAWGLYANIKWAMFLKAPMSLDERAYWLNGGLPRSTLFAPLVDDQVIETSWVRNRSSGNRDRKTRIRGSCCN